MNKLLRKGLIELSYGTGLNLIKPQFLSLIVTHRCNFRCPSCFNWQKNDYSEMSLPEWQKTAREIMEYFPTDTFVEINGGEPLLKADLVYELADILSSKFLLTLNTNGSLIDDEIAANLKKHGISTVKLSFYSSDKEVNDLLRGQSGSWDSAMSAIQIINRHGLNLELAVLITKNNIGQIPQLLEFAAGLPKTSVILQPLDEKIESPEAKDLSNNRFQQALWPTADEVNNFFKYLENSNHKSQIKNSSSQLEAIKKYYFRQNDSLKFRCFAGQRTVIINPDGNCLLCFKGGSIGNVAKGKISDILSGLPALEERAKLKKCRKSCRLLGCNYYRGFKEMIIK